MSIEQTSTGVRKNYGPRSVEDKAPARTQKHGEVNEIVVHFNYDDLPAASEVDALILEIPENSFILSSHTHVTAAWVGGTSLTLGLQKPDGTEIDNDGFDAAVLTAALVNKAWIVNDGALVGATIGADAGQIVASVVGTYTAGSAKLVVRYLTSAN